MSLQLIEIGEIITPYTSIEMCPNNVQTTDNLCEIKLLPEFRAGLTGLTLQQQILVLYWFENVERNLLQQKSSMTKEYIGTFSLRSPHRPNPIAAATVKVEQLTASSIFVKGMDCLSGTKLLDLKPAI